MLLSRSVIVCEFIEFLKLQPFHACLQENDSLALNEPGDRFMLTFTPKHGSWLNLIEGFVSKFSCSVLRHIRVASKQELQERITAATDFFNQQQVVHKWYYKLEDAA